MKITNRTASQLTKDQIITDTHTNYISRKGVVSEVEETENLRIVSVRKSKKIASGLRVKVQLVEGPYKGSGFTIVDFDNQAVHFETV